jgi:hypothetical protein
MAARLRLPRWPGSSWSARSRSAARTNELDAGQRRPIVGADELPSGSPEKAQALVRMKQAELTARNVAGGYWLAAADPAIVAHAITGDVPRQHVQRAALLSDGAARAVDPFGLGDWQDVLTILAAAGPGELIRQVRAAETADPAGLRWPRNKIHDDAAAILIQQ